MKSKNILKSKTIWAALVLLALALLPHMGVELPPGVVDSLVTGAEALGLVGLRTATTILGGSDAPAAD